jgi:hypothetical protein
LRLPLFAWILWDRNNDPVKASVGPKDFPGNPGDVIKTLTDGCFYAGVVENRFHGLYYDLETGGVVNCYPPNTDFSIYPEDILQLKNAPFQLIPTWTERKKSK